jgi:hypothetical protein
MSADHPKVATDCDHDGKMFRRGESRTPKNSTAWHGRNIRQSVSALLTGIAALGWNGQRDKAVLWRRNRAKDGMQQATA